MKTVLKKWSFPAAISIFILAACYVTDNLPYSFGGVHAGQRFQQLKELFVGHSEYLPDDYLAINVAYDRQLVPIADEYGFELGNYAITDRERLYWLIEKMRGTPYRFLILDINFDEKFKSPADSALFHTIACMPRTVIAKSSESELPEIIRDKAFYSEYGTTIEDGNFSKYDYFVHGERSLPLVVCDSLFGSSVKKFGPLYLSDYGLARRTYSFPITIRLWNPFVERDNMPMKAWYNIGSDLIDLDMDIPQLVNGRIVVVGDYCLEDIHDTYIGAISGPALNINAIKAVKSGALRISWAAILLLFAVYALIARCILADRNIYNIAPMLRLIRSRFVRWFISCAGLGSLLSAIAFTGWLIWGCTPNILIPTLVFSAIVVLKDLEIIKINK